MPIPFQQKHSILAAVLLLVFAVTSVADAQYSRYIIRLTDKKANGYNLSAPQNFLSARALSRRTRYKIAIDSIDLPVTKAYIDSIRAVPNVTVLNVSKWFNQVCIRTTDPANALAKINSFSFVQSSAPIAVRVMQRPDSVNPSKAAEFNQILRPLPVITRNMDLQDFYNYGNNGGQVRIHEGEYLHNLGFHGEGLVIAVLDAGFYNYKANPAFDSLRLQGQILGEADYVTNDGSVNEDHTHGAMCLSVLASNLPGKMVGTAPKAKYWLLRTEDAATEYPVEEQNWVAAAEFADSAGADMISSSLGYSDFDDPTFNHSYAQRNGTSALISKAASIAVRKGMIVCNSAGNSGGLSNDGKYVICPADADSVLSVGAVDVNGNIAYFSSIGPNGAGKLKPNVVSVGWNAVVINPNTGNPVGANGTSFSNPNMCGLVACLWQAFPEFTNMEICTALQKSTNKYSTPDYQYGYGIPNMRLAYQDLLQQRTVRNFQSMALGQTWIKAFPVPFHSELTVILKAPLTGNMQLRVLDMNGKLIETKTGSIQENNIYTFSFSRLHSVANGVYTIQYSDDKNRASLRVVKQ